MQSNRALENAAIAEENAAIPSRYPLGLGGPKYPPRAPLPAADTRFYQGVLDQARQQFGGLATQGAPNDGEQFQVDLTAAQQAIQAGRDPLGVRQKLLQAYPHRQADIDALLGR